MSDTVLISTHDLDQAGPLRSAFEAEGFDVELVTPDEDIARKTEASLLIVTGSLDAEKTRKAVRAAREEANLPVFGLFPDEDRDARLRVARELDLSDTFLQPVDPDEVLLLGTRLIKRRRLQQITGIVGRTDAIREALERVVQIAPVNSTVLLTGESGTGKELVARGIHALSPRKHNAFLAVNVAALSETLLESELFGHEKGAFTGAIDARKGFFELADGGTIFLDEIGEMPLATQTKLLRVLEQREFLRVGGEKSLKVDVRVITATNQDLRQLVAIGDFRRDLYYRLNVLHIELPPLRERKEDIPLLIREFVRETTERHGMSFPGISEEAMEVLVNYRWPGNVRELRNLVESMVVLAPGREIQPEDIPGDVRQSDEGRALLPALPARAGLSERAEEETGEGRQGRGGGGLRPELVEFIFRTLVELRVDLDDLRKDFQAYKKKFGERWLSPREGIEIRLPPGVSSSDVEDLEYVSRRPSPTMDEEEPEEVVVGASDQAASPADPGSDPDDPEESGEAGEDETVEDDRAVVFQPGMTMEDLERKAIAAALQEVDGNRRRAAELLGIGERTLYRKIRKYDLSE